jgi:hypothetical protein
MAQNESTFNAQAYLAAYPDVAAAIGQPMVESAWEHYKNFGKKEGRQAIFNEVNVQPNFNWQEYLATNPDVAASQFGTPEGAWEHYQNYGQREGRKATFDNPINLPQGNTKETFNAQAYLAANPDVAKYPELSTPEGAWRHYVDYGQREGRQATFDLAAKNTIPSLDKLEIDPNTGIQYSATPGHVGYIRNVYKDPENPSAGYTREWIPSPYDFSGAKFDQETRTFTMPSGEKVGYDFSSNSITNYATAYNQADPNTIVTGYGGQRYAPTSGRKTANFSGFNVPIDVIDQGEYLVDPNTSKYLKDASGNPIPVYRHQSYGFGDWIADNGWVIPLALGAGALTLGAGAAAGTGAASTGAAGTGAAGFGTFGSAGAAGTTPGLLSTTGGAGFGTFGSAGAAGVVPGVLSTTGGAGFGTLGSAGVAGVAPGVFSTTGEDFNMGISLGDADMQPGGFYGGGATPQATIVPGELGDIILDASGNIVTSSGSDILAAPSSFSISPMQAIQGLRAASGLLGRGQQQQAQALPQMGGAMTRLPQGAVDYSGLYNLLALQRARNPNSLLG